MGSMPLITPSMLVEKINVNPVESPRPVESRIEPASSNLSSQFNAVLESKLAGTEGINSVAGQGDLSGQVFAPAGNSDGDMILGGLQQLRSAFDAQQSRIADLMSGGISNTDAMLAMQMEMTNFSLLIDMTSKLASKAAQGLDTLMKGQ